MSQLGLGCQAENKGEGQTVILSEAKRKASLPPIHAHRDKRRRLGMLGSINRTVSEETAFPKISLGIRKPFALSN